MIKHTNVSRGLGNGEDGPVTSPNVFIEIIYHGIDKLFIFELLHGLVVVYGILI